MAKKPADERPMIMLRKGARGPVPATPYDQELWDKLPFDATVEVAPYEDTRGRRQLAKYWAVLGRAVDATGMWPNTTKCSDDLKRDCGYVSVDLNKIGIPFLKYDSIALDGGMTDDDREIFMEQAFARLAEITGIDPVELLREERNAA